MTQAKASFWLRGTGVSNAPDRKGSPSIEISVPAGASTCMVNGVSQRTV